MIEGDILRENARPKTGFLFRLERHLTWYLLRRFLIEHPILSAQLAASAAREAARFAMREKLDSRARDRDHHS